jgi:hypothetical protein
MMTCKSVQRSLWEFAEATLGEIEQQEVAAHLSGCGECDLHRRQVRSLSAGLRNLPVMKVPEIASMRLQVLASYRMQGRLPSHLSLWWARAVMAFNHLLKPLAVPAAGGLMASFLCFGVIVDTLQYRPSLLADIPVGLFTDVIMDEPSPFGCLGQDVMVQLTVDESGKVTDYTLPRGEVSPAQMQEIGNLVLYSTFIPATSFGQRISAKVLVNIHHIDVRG